MRVELPLTPYRVVVGEALLFPTFPQSVRNPLADRFAQCRRMFGLMEARLWLLIASIFLGFLVVILPSLAAVRPVSIYAYLPTANLKNAGLLSRKMGDFFQTKGEQVAFSAFATERDFAAAIAKDKPEFVLCAEEFVSHSPSKKDLVPILRPSFQGRSTYNKILLTKNKASLAALKGGILASTPRGEETAQDLSRTILANTELAGNFRFFEVNKDIDAIFALAFDRVDAALVAQDNLEVFRRLDPASAVKLKVLFTSPDLPLPYLYKHDKSLEAKRVEAITQALIGLHEQAAWRVILGILGYDKFVPVSGALGGAIPKAPAQLTGGGP